MKNFLQFSETLMHSTYSVTLVVGTREDNCVIICMKIEAAKEKARELQEAITRAEEKNSELKSNTGKEIDND